MGLLTHLGQEEPFDLSQKPPGLPSLRLAQSDGESVPGSSCQEEEEEDEDSLYRRSQYSPEVDQHEAAGEEQYNPKLEERGEGSPDEEQTYQQSLTRDTGAAAEEKGSSVDPRGDQVRLLQSETSCESDSEPGEEEEEEEEEAYHQETGHRQSCDSEMEDLHQDLDEPEQSKQQLDDFYEAAINVAERNQSGVREGELMSTGMKRSRENEERERKN